jgi:hypothetical protein
MLKDEDGGVLGVASIVRDVTARWEKEKGLMASLERFRRIAGELETAEAE